MSINKFFFLKKKFFKFACFDYTFLFGDLNYRVDLERKTVDDLIRREEIKVSVRHNDLLSQKMQLLTTILLADVIEIRSTIKRIENIFIF